MSTPQFRRPLPEEQEVLDGLTVRPIQPQERRRYDELVQTHHYICTPINRSANSSATWPLSEAKGRPCPVGAPPPDTSRAAISSSAGPRNNADPSDRTAAALLRCRGRYWGLEAGHPRLDITLDEDRSPVRTARGMTGLGMFRRLALSFACAWLDHPARRKAKLTTRNFLNFLNFLNADNARRPFSLRTSANPTAWKAE